MNNEAKAFAANSIHIPSKLIAEIQDLDPVTDERWERRLVLILKELGSAERRYVYSQFMEPKGIEYKAAEGRFIFQPRETLRAIASQISHGELREIAGRLVQALDVVRNAETDELFADNMESAIDLIERFDSGENLAVQKSKNALRSALLSELVTATREAKFAVSRNLRGLSVDTVKRYAIEVFLKHKMLGYRFRTLPIGTLEEHPIPFIREVVAREARTRECDIIRTDTTIYLIGPVRSTQQDPFSLRRFLREEKMMAGGKIYFNVAPVMLARIKDEKYQQGIELVLTNIVTLQRQLSEGVVRLIREIQEYRHNELSPMLAQKLNADGTSVDFSIGSRLREFQKNFEQHVLERIQKAIHELASSPDDYDYLFFSLRQFLIEIGNEVRDFAAQSAAMWSRDAVNMDLKLMSLLQLIDKRKDELFTRDRPEVQDPVTNVKVMTAELNDTLLKSDRKALAIKTRINEVLERSESKRSFFAVWLQDIKDKISHAPTVDDMRVELEKCNRECFATIIRIMKRYPQIKVYLEFEEVTPVVDGVRHYAVSRGDEGMTQLPALLRLQEDMQMFDISAVRGALIN